MLRAEAIQALVPGANFSTTGDNIFIWESDKPQPSEDEINAKILFRNSETRGGAEIKIEWSNKNLLNI